MKVADREQVGCLETGRDCLAGGDAAVNDDTIDRCADHCPLQISFGLTKPRLAVLDLCFGVSNAGTARSQSGPSFPAHGRLVKPAPLGRTCVSQRRPISGSGILRVADGRSAVLHQNRLPFQVAPSIVPDYFSTFRVRLASPALGHCLGYRTSAAITSSRTIRTAALATSTSARACSTRVAKSSGSSSPAIGSPFPHRVVKTMSISSTWPDTCEPTTTLNAGCIVPAAVIFVTTGPRLTWARWNAVAQEDRVPGCGTAPNSRPYRPETLVKAAGEHFHGENGGAVMGRNYPVQVSCPRCGNARAELSPPVDDYNESAAAPLSAASSSSAALTRACAPKGPSIPRAVGSSRSMACAGWSAAKRPESRTVT